MSGLSNLHDCTVPVVLGTTVKQPHGGRQAPPPGLPWGTGVLKYDFRPDSVDDTRPGELTREGANVAVQFHSTQPGQMHVFKGKAIPTATIDCVLIYDVATQTFTLERQLTKVDLKRVVDHARVQARPGFAEVSGTPSPTSSQADDRAASRPSSAERAAKAPTAAAASTQLGQEEMAALLDALLTSDDSSHDSSDDDVAEAPGKRPAPKAAAAASTPKRARTADSAPPARTPKTLTGKVVTRPTAGSKVSSASSSSSGISSGSSDSDASHGSASSSDGEGDGP
eukprot:Unigene8841_Nuclearia_a/m.27055 Unigene8841_Nuclearia_a/g.27055  ORF Unigene8841_Nuclearia_a/g.27055 Unigene8841_Nuclearia_a/m.27055 type:complete len:283 (-) Unigene8841_Nuclearia_a:39-887(-)